MRRHRMVALSLAITGVLLGLVAQPAMAVTYHQYFNDYAHENEGHSWTGTNISGGGMSLNIQLAEFKMYMETHSGYGPNYHVHGELRATAPGWTYFGHDEISSNATSACWWTVPEKDIGGDLLKSCRAERY